MDQHTSQVPVSKEALSSDADLFESANDNQLVAPEVTEEQDELDLSNIEGLDLFKVNIEEVYVQIFQYESELLSDPDFDSKSTKTVVDYKLYEKSELNFNEILEIISSAKEALEISEEISDEQIERLQELYDDLLNTRNFVEEVFSQTEVVDLSEEEVVELVEQSSEIDPDETSIDSERISSGKTMDIEGESDGGNISISVSEGVKEKLTSKKLEAKLISFKPTIIPSSINHDESSALASVEDKDPINEVIDEKKATVVHPRSEKSRGTMVKEYLHDKKYVDFLKERYPSPLAFERTINSVISSIESEKIDALEKWFGDDYASPFEFIKDMSVKEILDLSNSEHSYKQSIMRENNFKYETFLSWVDLIEEMQSVVSNDTNLKFGELFIKWIIEEQMKIESS